MSENQHNSNGPWMCLLCGRKDLPNRNQPHFCGHKFRVHFKKAALKKLGVFSCFVQLQNEPHDKAQHCDQAHKSGGKTAPLNLNPPKGNRHGQAPTGLGETTIMTAGILKGKPSREAVGALKKPPVDNDTPHTPSSSAAPRLPAQSSSPRG